MQFCATSNRKISLLKYIILKGTLIVVNIRAEFRKLEVTKIRHLARAHYRCRVYMMYVCLHFKKLLK